jgi:hypothetical protein
MKIMKKFQIGFDFLIMFLHGLVGRFTFDPSYEYTKTYSNDTSCLQVLHSMALQFGYTQVCDPFVYPFTGRVYVWYKRKPYPIGSPFGRTYKKFRNKWRSYR